MKEQDNPTTDDLRDALIAAVGVARDGKEEKPPVDPPTRLKQFLTFKKFSERALTQVRAVVESDDDFRERVIDGTEEDDVGRIGWLWLTRPEGWEAECQELAAAAEQESEQAADAQSTQALEQKRQRAEAAQQKAERQREKAERDRDTARTEAAQARTEARQAAEEAKGLTEQLGKMRAERDEAQKTLERTQRTEARTEAKLKSAQAQIDRLKKDLRDAQEQRRVETGDLSKRLAAAEEEVAMARAAGFEPPTDEEDEPEPPPPLTHRTPATLPSGMLKDTVEAAEHLLRHIQDVAVLVDGYNVTFKSWQEMPVREQRVRLLQKLEELSSRYSGAEFVVVFDGTATDYDYIATTARSLGVTVRFSKPGVTADDNIIELCDSYPLWRPLVVVSEDNEVRERARDRGANLVRPYKLLEIMGLEVVDPQGWPGFEGR